MRVNHKESLGVTAAVQQKDQCLFQAGELLFEKVPVPGKLLINVVADQMPQSVVHNGVDMRRFNADSAQNRKGVPGDGVVKKDAGVPHERNCQIPRPGKTVSFDAVVEKVHHAEAQRVGALEPYLSQERFFRRGKGALVGRRMKKASEFHLRGTGIFHSDISQSKGDFACEMSRRKGDQLPGLLLMGGSIAFCFGQTFAHEKFRSFAGGGFDIHIAEDLPSGIPQFFTALFRNKLRLCHDCPVGNDAVRSRRARCETLFPGSGAPLFRIFFNIKCRDLFFYVRNPDRYCQASCAGKCDPGSLRGFSALQGAFPLPEELFGS